MPTSKSTHKLKSVKLTSIKYMVNVQETEEGLIIDVYDKNNELIETYTHWNEDS